MEAKKLTKKDLWKVFRGQLTIRGANNYERQQNAGFTQAMMPVIEKVYDNDEDKREAYERHMEYFLTNDITVLFLSELLRQWKKCTQMIRIWIPMQSMR